MERQRYVEHAINAVGLGIFLIAITGAFSKKSRREILERDENQCVQCGADYRRVRLEASHLDHNRDNPDYDNPDNGETLCVTCHYQFHLSHRGRAEEIGLSEAHNEQAIGSLYGRLDPWVKKRVRRPDDPQLRLAI